MQRHGAACGGAAGASGGSASAVDFEALIGIAADAGYSGWLVVEAEQDPAIAKPMKYAKMGYSHLAGVVGRNADTK